jgi:hypothetical protein
MEIESGTTPERLNGLSILLTLVYADVAAVKRPVISSTSVTMLVRRNRLGVAESKNGFKPFVNASNGVTLSL